MKLIALTESSNKYEAINAQAKIEALCRKYKVDINDLTSEKEEVKERLIYWYNMPYKKLAIQILYMLFPETPIYSSRVKQNNLVVDLSDGDFAQLELYWNVLKPALKKYMENSVSAFIAANNLYPKDVEPVAKEYTEEDYKIMEMAQSIDATPIHQALENKNVS
tara:strand:- start:9028 stop:9519 length:492 start_codon:yes stop_codon:yes gene_type:complete